METIQKVPDFCDGCLPVLNKALRLHALERSGLRRGKAQLKGLAGFSLAVLLGAQCRLADRD
jgi:hypothetical protein